ncbi:MAG: FHA domain-containing protein [Streptosporangiaceae bacterium]
MSGHGVLPGLWPIQGDGVLARQRDLVLLVHPVGGPLADRLLDLLADAARADEGGRHFTERVSAAFDSDAAEADTARNKPSPAAVAFGPDGAGTAIALYGTAWAEVATAYGVQRLTAGEPYGRLRCVLPSKAITIRAGAHEGDADAGTDPYLRIADGIVRAVALVYSPEDAAGAKAAERDERAVPGRAAAAEAADLGEPVTPDTGSRPSHAAVASDFTSVSFVGGQADGDVPQREPLPLGPEPPDEKHPGSAETKPPHVTGVYCKNGHFDDPEARYCAVCGIGMAQRTKARRKGKRPPLGVLILNDGSVFELDTDYVIGREPSLHTSVADGSARPLRLADTEGVVSRIHARVELDGWQVYISDLNSANGTQILLPGETDGTLLVAGVRTPIVAGTEVRLGPDHGFRYDSHRHR